MKRHATTLVLLLFAVALGIFLWFDRERVTEGEKRRREDNVFPAWRRDALSRIEIATSDETLVLERDAKADGTWRMRAPRDERADVQAVERLMTTLEFATVQRRATESASLGFDAPRATGSLSMGGLVYRFVLGGISPRPEGSSYLRVDDGAPIVVSREVTSTLLAGADTYRDRTVVPYLSIELARFQVERKDGGFTLVHDKENAFRVEPEGLLAGRDALDAVWSALAAMRAESFPKGPGAPPADAVTVRMTPRDTARPTAVLVVGGACPDHPDDVLVRRDAPASLVACAPKGVLSALESEPRALVSTKPFSLRSDEIEELVLERLGDDAGALGPARVEIARKAGTFHMRAPDDRDLSDDEADAANELLSRIAQTSEASGVGRSDAAFTAAYRARVMAGEHEETVEVASLDGEQVRALRRADGALLTLPRAAARRLVPRRTSVRPRFVMPGETRRPVRVELRCGTAQTYVDRGDGFRMAAPLASVAADGTFVGLVEALSKGHVDAWVADADDGTFGLDPNGCRAILVFEEGKESKTVTLGAEGEGGVYGAVSGDGAVFVAPRALRQMLQTIYVSRTMMRVDPQRLVDVDVTVGKRAIDVPVDRVRTAAGSLFADEVLAIGDEAHRRAPSPVLSIVMHSGGGGPVRLGCGPARTREVDAGAPSGTRRVCMVGTGRDGPYEPILFAIDEARLQPFLDPREVAEAGLPR